MEIEMELTSLPDCLTVNQKLNEKMEINTVIHIDVCIIENICLRFPHLMEQINELLDNKSLMKCKEVSRTMFSNIENQKSGTFLTKRLIQSYNKNTKKFAEEWKIVFKKLSSDRLNEFGNLVKEFHKAVPSRCELRWCPMSIAAERGRKDFCKSFAKMNILSKYECSYWSLFFLPKLAISIFVNSFTKKLMMNAQKESLKLCSTLRLKMVIWISINFCVNAQIT